LIRLAEQREQRAGADEREERGRAADDCRRRPGEGQHHATGQYDFDEREAAEDREFAPVGGHEEHDAGGQRQHAGDTQTSAEKAQPFGARRTCAGELEHGFGSLRVQRIEFRQAVELTSFKRGLHPRGSIAAPHNPLPTSLDAGARYRFLRPPAAP
jgi:hypothetical protein